MSHQNFVEKYLRLLRDEHNTTDKTSKLSVIASFLNDILGYSKLLIASVGYSVGSG